MSRGHHQPIDIGWAEYRQMIGRIGPQARPRFFDARVHKARRKLDRGGKNFLDSACCHAFVETSMLDGCPRDYSPIVPRDQINLLGPQHAVNLQIIGS